MKKLILLSLIFPLFSFADALDDYKSTCKDIGFKPGTEKFGDCVLKLKKKDVQAQVDRKEDPQNQYLQQQLELQRQQIELQKQLAEEQIRSSKSADKRASDAERLRFIQQGIQMMNGPRPQTQTYQFRGGPPVTCSTLNGLTSCT